MFAKRKGFTLIELLVVIAIIAVLIGLLVPAVQKVRDAANRAQSQNNLKQLALACHSFHDASGSFQAASYTSSPSNPAYNYSTWIIPILPHIEQENLYRIWYSNPTPTFQYNGPGGPAATVIKTLLAPSDALGSTPHQQLAPGANASYPNGRFVGLTSYGCNGGTAAPLAFIEDGVFHYNYKIRIPDILDGTGNTILLGERFGFDKNWSALTRTATNDMRGYSAWAGGPFFAWRTSLVQINYRLPDSVSTTPPPAGSAAYFDLYYRRLFAYGSSSESGASVSFADGSVRLLGTGTNLLVLRELSTRASGNVIPGEY